MQGTAGDEGDPKARDPVDRISSRVQAVACFVPPTDFLNYGKPGEVALGTGVLKDFPAPFDFHRLDPGRKKFVPVVDENERLEIGRQISPINHVSTDDPPTLIIHGDATLLRDHQYLEWRRVFPVSFLVQAGDREDLEGTAEVEHFDRREDQDTNSLAVHWPSPDSSLKVGIPASMRTASRTSLTKPPLR
jgi:hypothetical protein